MPNEIKNYLKTRGKKMVYSSDEIQERDSVLCGYESDSSHETYVPDSD